MRDTRRGARLIVLALGIGLGVSACVARPAPPPRAFPDVQVRSRTVQAILTTARDLEGTRYHFGGQLPSTGFDCSGFVRYVLAQHAVDLPRTVAEQYRVGRSIPRADVQPGDLIFFSTVGPGPTHVGIALGAPDRPQFIHAPDSGGRVRIERFDSAYWRTRWVGSRRVF